MLAIESSFATAPGGGHTPADLDRTVVWLRGDHDGATAVALSATVAQAVARDDADVVVDLSDVQYLGAPTLDIILRAVEILGRRSRSLTLRAPSRSARQVLEVCDLLHLIDPGVAPASPDWGPTVAST